MVKIVLLLEFKWSICQIFGASDLRKLNIPSGLTSSVLFDLFKQYASKWTSSKIRCHYQSWRQRDYLINRPTTCSLIMLSEMLSSLHRNGKEETTSIKLDRVLVIWSLNWHQCKENFTESKKIWWWIESWKNLKWFLSLKYKRSPYQPRKEFDVEKN